MKKSKLFASILVASLAFNAFVLFSGFEPVIQTQCPDLPSYASGISMSNVDAKRCMDNFKNTAPEGALWGGVISGDALNQALATSGTNSLSYYFASDPEGNIAGGKTFVVIVGSNAVSDGNGGISSISRTSQSLFRTNSWCPTNCVALQIK